MKTYNAKDVVITLDGVELKGVELTVDGYIDVYDAAGENLIERVPTYGFSCDAEGKRLDPERTVGVLFRNDP